MFGSLPSFIQRSSRCGSIPSKPRMTIFCVNFAGPRVEVPEQAIDSATNENAAAANIRTDLRMWTARIITSPDGTLCPGSALRAAAVAAGAGVHAVRHRLAPAGDRGLDRRLLGRAYA